MIDAKNLRVGNWVSVNGVSIKVESIVEDDGINQSIEGDYYGGWIAEYEGRFHDWQKNGRNVVNGIELTEELLIKCGFEFSTQDGIGYAGWYKKPFDDKFSMRIWYEDLSETFRYSISDFHSIWIQHLHQLQNLYWCLTQKELEVNL